MTLTQMQYFQTVCKYKSFTRASEELHISQPALSLSIRKLEQEINITLFQSDIHGAVLTAEGEQVLQEIQRVLAQYKEMCTVIHGISKGRSYIRIGLSSIISAPVFPSLQLHFQAKYPHIRILSQASSIMELFRLLDVGQLDLIVTAFTNDMDPSNYGHYPLKPCERLLFCVSCQHPLAKSKIISWEQMAQENLILLHERFHQTQTILEEFRQRNLSPRITHVTEQIFTVERFIEDNAACGFLPESTVQKNPAIAGLPYGEPENRMIELIWKKKPYTANCVKDFIHLAKELY